VKKLEDDSKYDSSDWLAAMEKSTIWGEEIPIGKFFERTDLPALHEAEPVTQGRTMLSYPLHIDPAVAKGFVDELM
jgi:2-oxoglutarate/2-oxoacid ferredoxin oxidoreductase subunit beta